MYNSPDNINNYKFISPHDRLYRDCLKDVQWDNTYTSASIERQYWHGLAFIACLILLTYTLLLITN